LVRFQIEKVELYVHLGPDISSILSTNFALIFLLIKPSSCNSFNSFSFSSFSVLLLVSVDAKLFDGRINPNTSVTTKIIKKTFFHLISSSLLMTCSTKNTNILYFQMDDVLKQAIEERYMKSYACGLIIKEMVEKEFNWM